MREGRIQVMSLIQLIFIETASHYSLSNTLQMSVLAGKRINGIPALKEMIILNIDREQ